jgi:hypothetical protein
MDSYKRLVVTSLLVVLAAPSVGCATVGADRDFGASPGRAGSHFLESGGAREPPCFPGYPIEMRASPPLVPLLGCPNPRRM